MLTPILLNPSHRGSPPEHGARAHTSRLRRYLLEVSSEISAIEQASFEKQGSALLPTFKAAHLKIVASGWGSHSDPAFVIHYWDLGNDANGLLEAELALPDIPAFNRFNKLAKNEIKNIVIPLAADQFTPIVNGTQNTLPRDSYVYLRVSIEVERTAMGSRFIQQIRLAAGSAGDRVELVLPMNVQRITCDPKVTADRGRVALRLQNGEHR